MKKIISFTLVLMLTLSLCACGNESAENEEILVGGWTEQDGTVDADAAAVFEKAVAGTEYEDYTVDALLETQVVAGTNYRFLCTAPDGTQKEMVVYRDLSDTCSITEVSEHS